MPRDAASPAPRSPRIRTRAVRPELVDADEHEAVLALRARRAGPPLSVADAFARFTEACEREGRSPRTTLSYRKVLSLLARFLADERGAGADVWAVAPGDLEAWLLALRREPSPDTGRARSPATIESYGTQMLAALRWLEGHGLAPPRLTAGIPSPKIPRGQVPPPHTYTDAQVRDLFAVAAHAGATGAGAGERGPRRQAEGERIALMHRNRALLAVLLDAGPRVSELLSMRVEHADLERGTLRIETSKTRRREVGVGLATVEHLRRYLARGRVALTTDTAGVPYDADIHADAGPLFVGRDGYPLTAAGVTALFRRLRAAARAEAGWADGQGCYPHLCRRYAITNALRNGMPPFEAARHFAVSIEVIMTNYYAYVREETLHAARAASPLDRLARDAAAAEARRGGRRPRGSPGFGREE